MGNGQPQKDAAKMSTANSNKILTKPLKLH